MRMNWLIAAILPVFLTAVLPASAQDWAKATLEKSSRHLEWVTVKAKDRAVKCFIAYPEIKNKATAVVLIHEIFGLSDWVRSMTDQLAAAGYIAIAPDLLSDGKDGTSGYKDQDAVRKAVSSLPPDQVTSDLDAVTSYVSKLPAANGKVAVAGFCWGGSQAFRFANNNSTIKDAFVFYETGPSTDEQAANINAPVHGFYAENDARVSATLDTTRDIMKKSGKTFEPVVYSGAGHGFMREGQAPEASPKNLAARDAAWKRLTTLLHKL